MKMKLSFKLCQKSLFWKYAMKPSNHDCILLYFYKQLFFSTQPQCSLTFSWIELQILLNCCLVHKTIIMLRHFLYLLCLCPCLDLSLFRSYLRDPFFIFVSIFIMINRIISWIQTYMFFCLFLRICPIIFGW